MRPGQQWRNQPQEKLEADLDTVRQMLTDILIPSKFQDKPNTFVRNRLKEAIADNRYNNWITTKLMQRAAMAAMPAAWLEQTFADVMKAITHEKDQSA